MTRAELTRRSDSPDRIATRAEWMRLTFGFVVVFALFQWSAVALGSDYGQKGVAIAALVVLATLGIERISWGRAGWPAARSLGLGWPSGPGLWAAAGISALLLLMPLSLRLTGTAIDLRPGWAWLLPGLFAQAGIAEEVLFRGYLFGHVRRDRSFWRAAMLAMVPFVAAHVLLFFTMPWPLALAALALSVVMSLPLAHLFELGGGTIWAPALLHAVVQGTVKILVVGDASGPSFPLLWIAASALVPMLAFAIPRRTP